MSKGKAIKQKGKHPELGSQENKLQLAISVRYGKINETGEGNQSSRSPEPALRRRDLIKVMHRTDEMDFDFPFSIYLIIRLLLCVFRVNSRNKKFNQIDDIIVVCIAIRGRSP